MGSIADQLSAPGISIDALLALWRVSPHPLLAEAIDALTAVHPPPMLHGRTQKDTIARLSAVLEAEGNDADLGAALRAFPTGKLADATLQLDQLLQQPRDPRMAARMLDLLADPPYRTPKAHAWWLQVLALVIKTGDPRSAARVQTAIDQMHSSFAAPMAGWLKSAFALNVPKIEVETPPIEAPVRAALQALIGRTQVDIRTRQSLADAVYDEPDELDLRLVFADACLAINDPRGEAIMLQEKARTKLLSASERARLKQLIAAYQAQWLGDMDRVLLSASVRWELGFLASATLRPKHIDHIQPLVGDARWGTVRALVFGKEGTADDAWAARPVTQTAVLHPACGALRSVTGKVPPALALAFCDGDRIFPLETLTIYAPWPDVSVRADRVALAPTLPHLKHLDYRASRWTRAEDADWLIDSPLGRRLETLAVTGRFDHLEGWIARIATGTLRTLTVQGYHGYQVITLSQGAEGLTLDAYFRWPGMQCGDGDPFAALVHALGRLTPGAVHTLTLKWTRDYAPRANQIADLTAAISALQPQRFKHPKIEGL